MRERWTTRRVQDLVLDGSLQFSDGYRTRKDQLGKPGLPILRVADVLDGEARPAVQDHVLELFRAKMGGKTSRAKDVLITTKGTVGRVAQVPDGFPEHVYSPQLCFFRALDGARLDPGWLYCWARSPEFSRQADAHKAQTDMAPYLSLGDLSRFTMALPPIEEQRRIAAVLGALDDLIDTSQRLSRMTLAMADTVYENGVQLSATAATVGGTARFENKRRIPLSSEQRLAMPGAYPYYGATGVMATVGDYIFDDVRVLVGEDGTVTTSAGTPVVQLAWGKYWVNNHAHVLAGEAISTELLRIALRHASVAGSITGAVQAKLSMGNLKSVRLVLPRGAVVEAAIRELAAAERACIEEAAGLVQTRDELLPLLMSGAVSPGEVDVGAA